MLNSRKNIKINKKKLINKKRTTTTTRDSNERTEWILTQFELWNRRIECESVILMVSIFYVEKMQKYCIRYAQELINELILVQIYVIIEIQ